MQEIILQESVSVNARKLKSGCDFSFPSLTRIHPKFSTSLIFFCAPKVFSLFLFSLGVCTVRQGWFFSKFTTEPIEIDFFIIETNAHRLGFGFLTYCGAVFTVGFIGLISLNIKNIKNVFFTQTLLNRTISNNNMTNFLTK